MYKRQLNTFVGARVDGLIYTFLPSFPRQVEKIADTLPTDVYKRQLLENPEVEAVYCAVPHNLHAQVYSDVIRAGKHLLGEKPFG